MAFFLFFILIIFVNKFGYYPSNNIQTWNSATGIINSLVSPCVALISLILLYRIWIDNKNELQKTQEALEEQSTLHKYNIIENTILKLTNQLNDEIAKINNIQCTGDAQGGTIIKRKYTALKDGEVPLQNLKSVIIDYFSVAKQSSTVQPSILDGYHKGVIESEQFDLLTSTPLCISRLTKDIKSKSLKKILHQILFCLLTKELLLVIAKRAYHQYEKTNEINGIEKERFKVMFLEFTEILDENCNVNDLGVFNLNELCLYLNYRDSL